MLGLHWQISVCKVQQELLPENHVGIAGILRLLGSMEMARHRWQAGAEWTEKVRAGARESGLQGGDWPQQSVVRAASGCC